MPTYEYVCEACEHQFDEFQNIKDKPLKKCPKCGKNKLRRLIGAGVGLIFRGSGFYITDYRSDSYKAAAKAEQEATKPADGKTETESKTETKPAAESAPPKKAASKSGKKK